MNIFHLDTCPTVSAQMMCDKHVVKMIVETAQLLSTAHRVLDGVEYYDKTANGRRIKRWKHPTKEAVLYKASHVNHPSGIWTRTTNTNYAWLYRHFVALCEEYTYRYGRVHMSESKMRNVLCEIPENIGRGELTRFAMAMPEYCKVECPVESYRLYYINEKKGFAKWTNRDEPSWWK